MEEIIVNEIEKCQLLVGEKFDTDDELLIEIESTINGDFYQNIWLSRDDVMRLINILVTKLAQR